MSEKINKLYELYSISSKHSNYQILPEPLLNKLNTKNIVYKNMYEKERLKFILDHLETKNKRILDVGGNTGYFTIELLLNGFAERLIYFDGNRFHSEFVKIAGELLEIEDRLIVNDKYYTLDEIKNSKDVYDITLLLNVLHHLGDDFGIRTTPSEAKLEMLEYLNSLAYKTKYLVLQLGFNWCGDKNQGLFENGTKQEMIEFIEKGTNQFWTIELIGIAESKNSNITYTNLNAENIIRDDGLGEFLNRPIFILKSLKLI